VLSRLKPHNKGVLSLLNLQQSKLQCTTQCPLSNDEGQLTSDAGHVLVKEFIEKIYFEKWLDQTLHFQEPRKYWTYEQNQLFQQLLLQLIADYAQDSATQSLRKDPLFAQVFQKTASQPTLSRFINENFLRTGLTGSIRRASDQ